MTEIRCDMSTAKAAVLGGCLLGGGGGGPKDQGFALGELAIQVGQPRIVNIDSLHGDDKLLTVALVGSPASPGALVKPIHYFRSVELMREGLKQEIAGLITNENGAVATVNGWFQSAVTGIPVVDAPCNGRAHPTGSMGSMGLDRLKNYVSIQSFAGGGSSHPYVEGTVRSNLGVVSRLVRQASISAGGFVAVARNPVEASYVKQHGAPGAIYQAIEVGQTIVGNMAAGGIRVAEACADLLSGDILLVGEVERVNLDIDGGFDVGEVVVKDSENSVRMTFWNEYMTADKQLRGRFLERVATFPDLIVTMDCESGMPLTTAEVEKGQRVVVLVVPKAGLKLSSTMGRKDLMEQVENVIGEPIVDHL